MNNDPARRARQEALQHAMTVLGVAAQSREAGNRNQDALLFAAREQVAGRGMPGQPGSAEYEGGKAERAAILKDIDDARAGAGAREGLEPITWAELKVQGRLKTILGL